MENAIVDDEFGQWLQAIRAKGAFCLDHLRLLPRRDHDAQRRGAGAVSASAPEVLVPRDVLAKAVREARQAAAESLPATGPAPRAPAPSTAAPFDQDMVAMCTCQSNELAPEVLRPSDSETFHGLFTYTLAQVLTQASSPLTYRELAQQVAACYRAEGRW